MIRPADVKVLVLPDPVEEKKGSILLPDQVKERDKFATTRGTIVAKGPNAFAEWGAGNGPDTGARVIFAQYAGLRVKDDDGTEHLIMNDEDVIGEVAA